jgi:hypothetical protein
MLRGFTPTLALLSEAMIAGCRFSKFGDAVAWPAGVKGRGFERRENGSSDKY